MKRKFGIAFLVISAYFIFMCLISLYSINSVKATPNMTGSYLESYNVGPDLETPFSHMSIDEMVSFGIGCSQSGYVSADENVNLAVMQQKHFFIEWTYYNAIGAIAFLANGLILLRSSSRRKETRKEIFQ